VVTRLRTNRALRARVETRARSSRVAGVAATLTPFAIAFAVYLAALVVMDPEATGDEPHYFLVAQSLALDGDIDLANDYASRERTLAACRCFPLEPHAYIYTSSGALVPYHGAGLALLLAPAVALGGLAMVRLTMVLVAALLAHQLYRLLVQLGVARAVYRWAAWIAVAFCLPLVAFSNQVYPEVGGALLSVIALRVVVTPSPGKRGLLIGSIAGAALPWLHTRFWPISLLVFAGLVYRASRGCELRRFVRGRTFALRLVLPYAVSFGALAGLFVALFGSPLPDAAYRPASSLTLGSGGWTFWYRYLLADFLNPSVGWIPYAPVHWLGLAGIGCLVWRFGGGAVAIIAAAVGYAALIESIGHPIGYEFPARYLIIVIPLVAIPLAIVLETVSAARFVFVPLLAVSLVFAASSIRDYQSLYPLLGDRYTARLFGVRSIQTAFPDTSGDRAPTSIVLRPADVAPKVGRLERGPILASQTEGDQAGFMMDSPYVVLRSGRYVARFSVAGRGSAGLPVGQAYVASAEGQVLAQRFIAPTRAGFWPALRELRLEFTTPGNLPIQTRVFFHGFGELAAGWTRVTPLAVTPAPKETFPDWPLAFLWVAGTALVGVLFVQVMDRRER
jgi:hypothetical protein